MASYDWKKRQHKEAVRIMALADGFPKRRRSALMMPSSDAMCVRNGIKIKCFDSDTKMICVERDPAVYRKMREGVSSLDVDASFVNGDLFGIKELPDGFDPLDYAFFDFTGNITPEMCVWVSEHLPRLLSEGCDLSWTLLIPSRANKFVGELRSFIKDDPRHLESARKFNDDVGIRRDDLVGIGVYVIRTLLADFDLTVGQIAKYRDTQTMLFFKTNSLRRSSNTGFSSLRRDIVALAQSRLTPNKETTMSSSRSNAAKKAHVTRAANKKKRHEAAVKSWDTRRKNEEARRRSAAANKAWDTRRANAG